MEAGVLDPRVLDAPLDLEESLLASPLAPTPPPRWARSLLISVVSTDGNESGNALVLVLVKDEVEVDVGLEEAVPDRQPYIGVARLPLTGVLATSVIREELDSLALDFSLDRARSRSPLSLLVLCVFARRFLGVAVRDFDRGVAAFKLALDVVVAGFARTAFCDSIPPAAFFFAALEAVAALFTFMRLVRTDTLPAMDELSLPPSLVPSPPVAPSRTSSGSVAHVSSYTEQQLTRLESQEASSNPPQLLP